MAALRGGRQTFGGSSATEIHYNFNRVNQAAKTATFRNLRHGAFSVAKNAKASIQKSNEPSRPGSPPTTRGRGRKNIRGAIFTDANYENAIIGPRASWVGDVGEAHEFGKNRKGQRYPQRSFMYPALAAAAPRFAADWAGTIGE